MIRTEISADTISLVTQSMNERGTGNKNSNILKIK